MVDTATSGGDFMGDTLVSAMVAGDELVIEGKRMVKRS